MFASTPVVTIRTTLAALRLKLWDEQRGCLVRWPEGLSVLSDAYCRAVPVGPQEDP